LSGEFQGTESLWLDSKLSVVVGPSRDGALGVIGLMTRPTLQKMVIQCLNNISKNDFTANRYFSLNKRTNKKRNYLLEFILLNKLAMVHGLLN